MKLRRYFPLGKAYGKAFCNREAQTAKLVDNIKRGVHSFLLAPRRYGKSSLCEKAFIEAALTHVQVDFHLAVSEKDVERFILKGVIDAIGQSMGQVDKWVNVIKQTVKHLKPKLDISAGPFTLELEVGSNSTPAENVAEALLLLDTLLQETDKQAVLLFDEFQEVGHVAKGRGVEGAIRHAAQETQNLAIIFSGSNPHLLKNMFENERRPLYKLCKKIALSRISVEHYHKHLNYAAQVEWGQNLPATVFDLIMALTARHPYYVNALCDEVWSECEALPNMQDIKDAWAMIIDGERSDLIKDFLRLSDNQRRVAKYIANQGGQAVSSNAAFKVMDIAPGSLHAAINILLERDFIERVDAGYELVVPVYKTLLKE
jgi:uncharacterized protein